MNKKTYTDPEISPKEPTPRDLEKTWFVHVRFFDEVNNKWVSKKFKSGVNSIKTFTAKLRHINDLRKAIADDLNNGWNPLTNSYGKTAGLSFADALDFALSKCDITENTTRNYRSTIKVIKQGADKINLASAKVDKIEKKHIKLILETCRSLAGWSNHAYNKHAGYLGSLMTQLVDWEIIKYNPAHRIKKLKVAETRKYVPYTEVERNRIKDYLNWTNERFFRYVILIFQTGIRPVEVFSLRIKDINFDTRVITILPNRSEKNSKTESIREVPINDYLLPLLRAQVMNYPQQYYVFGSPYESGKGNRSTGAKHVDYLKPSLVKVKRDTATKLWHELVMVDLKIPKHLYAAKHSGADSKILAGISIDALQEMYGHSSKLMTKKYITKLQEVHHKEIIGKATDF